MRITIITLFPESIETVLSSSIIGRAQKKGIVSVRSMQLRDYAVDKYCTVDDRPFGGGAGMILRVDVMDRAIAAAKAQWRGEGVTTTVLLDAGGTPYTQKTATRYATTVDHLILIAGHYEGVDERIRHLVDEEISIGPYIVTGGELPAMIVADSTIRLLAGALGNENSAVQESYAAGILEHPQYTKPRNFRSMDVPEILISGDHKKIATWQEEEALKRTKKMRPDLLKTARKASKKITS